jgi:hypothetical protein
MDSRDDDSKKSHLVPADALAIVALWSGALLACAGLSSMTTGGPGLGLPPFVSVAAAEEVKAPPADDGPPLAAEHHPPPVVNIIPRKPKSAKDKPAKDSSSKTSDAKDSAQEKVKAKKAALRKTKGR